jgi:galactonate dehydratase
VGPGVDLCIEIHRRFSPVEAAAFGRAIEQFRPFFVEDPTLNESMQTVVRLAREVPVPIAIGERVHTIFEFRELLEGGGIRIVRPDVSTRVASSSASWWRRCSWCTSSGTAWSPAPARP